MLPLRLIAVGIALFVLGFLLLYAAGNADRPDPYQFEFHDIPDGLFLFGFFGMSLCGAGVWLFLRGAHIGLGDSAGKRRLPRIFPEIELRNLTVWKGGRASQSVVMASLNAFSVSWICVLMTLVTIFMIMQPRPSRGLRIDWGLWSHISTTENPWARTMSVYVRSPGQFYVNGEAGARARLEGTLREELSHRAEWTVYVEADNDTQFSDTVYVIDTIQGLGGKVVWITPRTRENWKHATEPGKK